MTKSSKFRPYLAAAIINITSLCLGVSIGWMSPAAPSLQSEHPPIGGDSPLSDETISWLGSLQFVGGIAGVTFWGQITERFGRKPAGYLISIPLIIGWNTVLWATSDIWLMIGRFVLGLSGTGALILTPAYVSEVAEDSYRGALGSFIILSFNLGVVAAYFVGSIFSLKILTIFCGSIPIVFVCLFYFLPESPVFLWTKGKKTEAYESLLWYRSGNNTLVERELSILDSVVSSNKSIPISRLYDSKGTIKAMIISLALFAFQQFCGILMLLTYTSIILQKSQIEFSPHTASVVIGLVQLTSSWATSFIIDRIDRRILLIVSNLFMSVALFVIGLFFYLKDNSENNILPNWVPFIAICLHVVVYCASAPMPYIITTEILRPEVLPLAFSVTVFWGTIISFSSVKIYIILVEHFQMSGNFWFFAIWCIIAIIFTVFLIPETRGKPLLQVLKELEGEKLTRRNTKNVYEPCESEIPIRDYPTKTILVDDNNKNHSV